MELAWWLWPGEDHEHHLLAHAWLGICKMHAAPDQKEHRTQKLLNKSYGVGATHV